MIDYSSECGEESTNTDKDVDRSENVKEPCTNDCFTNCGYENLHGVNRMCHNELRSHLQKEMYEEVLMYTYLKILQSKLKRRYKL